VLVLVLVLVLVPQALGPEAAIAGYRQYVFLVRR
jgi:hypothetical protein